MKIETWRPVRGGYYEVSSLGRVRRAKNGYRTWPGRILKPIQHHKGYPVVSLTIEGEKIQEQIHVLVAEAFLGPRGGGLQVNHIDGSFDNNVPENLEYVTSKQNAEHAVRGGKYRDGQRWRETCSRKLDISKAREIRSLSKAGLSRADIAQKFGVSVATISFVLRDKIWKEIPA